jgi:hypothetical protein
MMRMLQLRETTLRYRTRVAESSLACAEKWSAPHNRRFARFRVLPGASRLRSTMEGSRPE